MKITKKKEVAAIVRVWVGDIEKEDEYEMSILSLLIR